MKRSNNIYIGLSEDYDSILNQKSKQGQTDGHYDICKVTKLHNRRKK